MPMKLRSLFPILLALTMTYAGCGGEDDPEPTRQIVAYQGEMFVDFTPGFVGTEGTEFVQLTIEDGDQYSILNLTRQVGLPSAPVCDSDGKLTNTGTDTLILIPNGPSGANCSNRIPAGPFLVDLSSPSDSLVWESVPGGSETYRFRLQRVNPTSSIAPTASH